MGLTAASTGMMLGRKKGVQPADYTVALAGNPNVGKSTVFNALTKMHQHTGNWPGKTVSGAEGICKFRGKKISLVDTPGAYSLAALSAEEEVTRDYLCFGGADAVVVVCDATCLERNLNLVLQTIEITPKVVVCVNLLDEAKKKHIRIDLEQLQERLGVPVVGTAARAKKGLGRLMEAVVQTIEAPSLNAALTRYPEGIEQAATLVETALPAHPCGNLPSKFIAMKLLENDENLLQKMQSAAQTRFSDQEEVAKALCKAQKILERAEISSLRDAVVETIYGRAEGLCRGIVIHEDEKYNARQLKLDRILTNKKTGIPIMLLLLAMVFYLTITGANVPSEYLSRGLFFVQDRLYEWMGALGSPEWLRGALVLGLYRVLAWVVSVMLPPMAIFFPLFTLLEDFGYLPRVAFVLDNRFRRCCACGKQALTMCMGFGCNAAGVIGCRIIDSKRERLIAILTNSFVPCNGRFPTLISVLAMFFAWSAGAFQAVVSTLLLTGVILLGMGMTFAASKFLSKTFLKGVPSTFTLELPPYRTPQIGKVIVRSIFDRTIFVLGRAVAVASPAGLAIWLLSNVPAGDGTLLSCMTGFLDPVGRALGLDGVILTAFILGWPANEIVVPIILMCYLGTGSLVDLGGLAELRALLIANGWTWLTAVCMVLFSLMHWPCTTTLLTIKKEAGGWKWCALAVLLPTVAGVGICFLIATAARLLGLA